MARFLAFVNKPLSWVTLTDFQAWAEHVGQGNLKPGEPEPGGHRSQEPAFVRSGNRLCAVILEESEVARLIHAAPQGRNLF